LCAAARDARGFAGRIHHAGECGFSNDKRRSRVVTGVVRVKVYRTKKALSKKAQRTVVVKGAETAIGNGGVQKQTTSGCSDRHSNSKEQVVTAKGRRRQEMRKRVTAKEVKVRCNCVGTSHRKPWYKFYVRIFRAFRSQ